MRLGYISIYNQCLPNRPSDKSLIDNYIITTQPGGVVDPEKLPAHHFILMQTDCKRNTSSTLGRKERKGSAQRRASTTCLVSGSKIVLHILILALSFGFKLTPGPKPTGSNFIVQALRDGDTDSVGDVQASDADNDIKANDFQLGNNLLFANLLH